MAKTAKRSSGTQPPISAHPAFPAIVALWFAALFGIGSLVLPAPLMERLLGSAPEFTTRLLIALGCSLIGAIGGLLIARKVISAQDDAGHNTKDESDRTSGFGRRKSGKADRGETKRPIVATEELGEEGLGPVVEDYEADSAESAKPALPGRRRALAVTDDTGRSEYFTSVPLPGESADDSGEADEFATGDDAVAQDPFGNAGAASEMPMTDTPHFGQPDDEPMALDGFAAEAGAEQAAHEADFSQSMDALRNPAPAPTAEDANPADGGEADAVPVFTPLGGAPATPAAPAADGARPFDGPTFNPAPAGEAAPMTFSPMPADAAPAAMDDVASDDPFAAPAPRQDFSAPAQPAPFAAPAETTPAPAPAPAPMAFAAPEPVAAPAAPLAELSMSELIGRFANALEADRADKAAALSAVASAPVEEVPAFSPSPEENPAPEALAADGEPLYNPFAPPQGEEAAPPQPFAKPEPQPAPFAPPAAASADVAEEEEPLPNPFAAAEEQTAEQDAIPSALRPLDLGAFDEEDSEDGEDDPFVSGLSFSPAQTERPFASPAPSPAPAPAPVEHAEPAPFAAPAASSAQAEAAPPPPAPPAEEEFDDSANASGYSSLLSMKRPIGPSEEFVRIEEDDAEDDPERPPEANVVFPGDPQATPPSPNPVHGARPFDAPGGPGRDQNGQPTGTPAAPAARPADPAETEKALREALDKLQRMSGAA